MPHYRLVKLAYEVSIDMGRKFALSHCRSQWRAWRGNIRHGSIPHLERLRLHPNGLRHAPGVLVAAEMEVEVMEVVMEAEAAPFLRCSRVP